MGELLKNNSAETILAKNGIVTKTNIASGVGLYILTYATDKKWADALIVKCDYPSNFTKIVSPWWNAELSSIDGKIAVKQTSWSYDTYIMVRKVMFI